MSSPLVAADLSYTLLVTSGRRTAMRLRAVRCVYVPILHVKQRTLVRRGHDERTGMVHALWQHQHLTHNISSHVRTHQYTYGGDMQGTYCHEAPSQARMAMEAACLRKAGTITLRLTSLL